MDIRTIRSGHLEDFLHWLPKRLAPKTKKNILGALHKVFSDAYRRDDIKRIAPFPSVDVPEPELKWLSQKWQQTCTQSGKYHDIFKLSHFSFFKSQKSQMEIRPAEAAGVVSSLEVWDFSSACGEICDRGRDTGCTHARLRQREPAE